MEFFHKGDLLPHQLNRWLGETDPFQSYPRATKVELRCLGSVSQANITYRSAPMFMSLPTMRKQAKVSLTWEEIRRLEGMSDASPAQRSRN
jgi:hypothetical protein